MKIEQSVPKRWHIKFKHRGITQKKPYSIQDRAKVWNQESFFVLSEERSNKILRIPGTLTHIHGFIQEYLNIQDVYYINIVLFCSVSATSELTRIPSCYFLTSCLYILTVGVSILRTSTRARQGLVTIP